MKLAHAKLSLDDRAKRLASALKKTAKPAAGRYADARNLYLLVSPTGAKSWVYIWTDKTMNKQRECGLGSFTGAGATLSLTLDAARIAADRVRAQIATGIDPIAAKITAKVSAATFEEMFRVACDLQRPQWKLKNGVYGQEKDWQGKMYLHAAKLIGVKANEAKGIKAVASMPVALITEDTVNAVLAPIWTKNHKTADTVRYIIAAVMDAAIRRKHYTGTNPALKVAVVSMLGKKAKGTKGKQPSLAYAKVPAAIATLLATGRMAALASVFCTLTATRSDEARLMKWSEVDFDAKLWIVPSERMKVENENDAEGDHYVPLSDAAIAVLHSIPRLVGNDYVFAGQKEGQTIGEGSLNVCIAGTKRAGGILFLKGEATQHGMRASFVTWAKEVAKIERDVRELCLAHKIGKDATERSYDRAAMLDDRRAALQAWGVHCMGRPTANANAPVVAANDEQVAA